MCCARFRLLLAALIAVAAAALVSSGCTDAGGSSSSSENGGTQARLRVLFAGSLIIPFEQVEKEFEALHPDIDVDMEGTASRLCVS